jgi:CRISPR/Cas system-associated endoribonuclease Cas2
MSKTKKVKQNFLNEHIKYVEFLKKRIQSSNFKNNVTKEEFEKTKKKYDKAKLKLKFMKMI